MGNKNSKASKHDQQDNAERKSNAKINCVKEQNVGFNIVTPPLLNGNEIILLSTTNGSTLYSIYDLNTSRFTTKAQEIKCDNDKFDVSNTVYTLNPNNNKIYFIENNKDIKILDMKTKEIKSLNKSISTTNGNVANIIYNNNNVYIIGAEPQNEQQNEYTIIPYSTVKWRGNPIIHDFGLFSRVINIKYDDVVRDHSGSVFMEAQNGLYVMGGEINSNKNSNRNEQPMKLPTSRIYFVTLLDNKGNLANRSHELPAPMHSFGIINYKHKYLILFGGTFLTFRREIVKQSRRIYISSLTKYNPFGLLPYVWYRIHVKLPEHGCFHALYPENSKSHTVHLFSYDGNHYEIKMEDIFDTLANNKYSRSGDWNPSGKGSFPSRSKSIKNMGPPSDIEYMLDELVEMDKEYEKYKKAFRNVDYDDIEDIFDDKHEVLTTFIVNQKHREIIIQKAKFWKRVFNSNTIDSEVNDLLKFVGKLHRLLVFGYVSELQLNIPHSIINYCLLYSCV